MGPATTRRSFLRWATQGLGAIFAAILGIPVATYLIDPRNRKNPPPDFRPVEGLRLSEVTAAEPRQGVIHDVRVDGWTLHPSDVIGRVWVVQDAAAPNGYRVFTTICPHLGCSVNIEGNEFRCPCHQARFAMSGNQIAGPALRGLDELEWERTREDPDVIRVRYESFLPAMTADKKRRQA